MENAKPQSPTVIAKERSDCGNLPLQADSGLRLAEGEIEMEFRNSQLPEFRDLRNSGIKEALQI